MPNTVIHWVAQHSHTSNAKGNLKKVLTLYKENISAAYDVLDIEIEEPPPVYDRDTKNKAEELDRLHAAMKKKFSHHFKYIKIANIDFGSWFLITKVLF